MKHLNKTTEQRDMADFVMVVYMLGCACFALGIVTGIVLHIIWVRP